LLRVKELCGAGRRDESDGIGESLDCLLQCSDARAAPFTSFSRVTLLEDVFEHVFLPRVPASRYSARQEQQILFLRIASRQEILRKKT